MPDGGENLEVLELGREQPVKDVMEILSKRYFQEKDSTSNFAVHAT
jgi:hypothetical protein